MRPIEHLDAVSFSSFAARPGIGVVHFWAGWDRSHLVVRQALEAAAEQVGGDVSLSMLDTDQTDAGGVCRGLRVAQVPTLVYYRNGERVGLQIGVRHSDAIPALLMRVRAGKSVDRA